MGGRPRALSEADVTAVKMLLADLEITTNAVARRLGVSPSPHYGHCPAAWATVNRNEPA